MDFKSINSKKIKIRPQRGVVRTIDFLVAFSLFIVLITQFFLVVINTNTFLAQETRKIENPAESLAYRILGSTGDKDWELNQNSPISFGLASIFSNPNQLEVDLSKLSRINLELTTINSAPYSFFDDELLTDQLLDEGGTFFFRISTHPLFQVEIIDSSPATFAVQVFSWTGKPLADVNVDVYFVSLLDGSADITLRSSGRTTSSGMVNVPIAAYVPGSGIDYLAVAFVHLSNFWGLDWTTIVDIPSSGNTINAGGFSSFLSPQFNSTVNGINLYSDQQINSQITFYDSISGSVNISQTASAMPITLKDSTQQTGTSGPVIIVQQIIDITGLRYRVVTIPFIYDNLKYNDGTSNQGYEQAQYPVYGTSGFSTQNFANIFTFTTIVSSIRGPFLMTFEVGTLR